MGFVFGIIRNNGAHPVGGFFLLVMFSKTNKKFMNIVKVHLEELYYNFLETWNKKTTVIFRKLEIILVYLCL